MALPCQSTLQIAFNAFGVLLESWHSERQSWKAAATTNIDKARLLAISVPHSSHWLFALPVSTCGLHLDNEAVRVTVAQRLSLEICELHQCPCGTMVDTHGTHGLSCGKSTDRGAHHQQFNYLVYSTFRLQTCGYSHSKEPAGLIRMDGKWPARRSY